MRIRGWVAGSAARLVLAGLLVAEFQRPLNSDSAWLLHLAARVAQGDRLYHDLIEINPPLVVWLQLPIVFLSERLGLDPAISLRIAVLIWIGGCPGLGGAGLHRLPSGSRSSSGSAGAWLSATGSFEAPRSAEKIACGSCWRR